MRNKFHAFIDKLLSFYTDYFSMEAIIFSCLPIKFLIPFLNGQPQITERLAL